MYRLLDSDKIIETIVRLEKRIADHFPASSLARVAGELALIARQDKGNVVILARPNWRLRVLVGGILLGGAFILWLLFSAIMRREEKADLFGALQGIDSGFNLLIVTGGLLFFVFSLEARAKRDHALRDLYELRSLVHVIDMHQLTKDPRTFADTAAPPAAETPMKGAITLTRYLDYCSELLSLCAKLAALYSQHSHDELVTRTVTDIERLASNLSQEIWQKIILTNMLEGLPPPAFAATPAAKV
jgi:hypothetical protein